MARMYRAPRATSANWAARESQDPALRKVKARTPSAALSRSEKKRARQNRRRGRRYPMPRLDRQAAESRAQAMRPPLTRANRLVPPSLELSGGVAIALSVNK